MVLLSGRLYCLIILLVCPRIPLGVVSALFLGVIWLSPYLEQPEVEGDGYGVLVFGVAAVIELMAEPLWVMAQINQYISLKVGSTLLLLINPEVIVGYLL